MTLVGVSARSHAAGRQGRGAQAAGNGRGLLLRRLERQDRRTTSPNCCKRSIADRKPVWGWKDDTVEIMQKQIDYCADHGIAFWAFDWYYPEGKNKTSRSTTPSDCI